MSVVFSLHFQIQTFRIEKPLTPLQTRKKLKQGELKNLYFYTLVILQKLAGFIKYKLNIWEESRYNIQLIRESM